MSRGAVWQRQLWEEAREQVRYRLARIERGESWAPPQMVRVLRAFVDDERKGR